MSTTAELMKKLIETKAELDKQTKEEKIAKLVEERDALIEGIADYVDRINDLIDVANVALKNGIDINHKGWGGHEGYDTGMFFTNSWSHLLGFVRKTPLYKGVETITAIGIEAGGACGNTDLIIDTFGNVYGESSHRDYKTDKIVHDVVEPPLKYLQRFHKEFNEFEKSFYDYIAKKCLDKHPLVSYEIKI